ncbi:hypothetical protein PR003_g8573 [Phytophthora rubi]|uniref:Uncharacterized protein n=1 Tax=Phytophthora rubi TaxID=129364 RepID=A0A6A4FII2_9STRA|nr:hypothetical protein PR003_g8573 [Phytophthora rubi]
MYEVAEGMTLFATGMHGKLRGRCDSHCELMYLYSASVCGARFDTWENIVTPPFQEAMALPKTGEGRSCRLMH